MPGSKRCYHSAKTVHIFFGNSMRPPYFCANSRASPFSELNIIQFYGQLDEFFSLACAIYCSEVSSAALAFINTNVLIPSIKSSKSLIIPFSDVSGLVRRARLWDYSSIFDCVSVVFGIWKLFVECLLSDRGHGVRRRGWPASLDQKLKLETATYRFRGFSRDPRRECEVSQLDRGIFISLLS